MLGFPAHFGQLECLKLIASPRFVDKRIVSVFKISLTLILYFASLVMIGRMIPGKSDSQLLVYYTVLCQVVEFNCVHSVL